MNTVKESIAACIADSDDSGFIRSEFKRLGSPAAITRSLRALIGEGRLVRIGYGVYAPASAGRMSVREADAVLGALTKLGAEPEWGGQQYKDLMAGRTTQMPPRSTVTVRKRMKRKIGRGNRYYRYEYVKMKNL